jgi:hypothetical protein
MRRALTQKPSILSPILCASILSLLSACSSGTGVNHKTAAPNSAENSKDGQQQTDAGADPAAIAAAASAKEQEIKDLTEKLKAATELNASLDDDLTHGLRGELLSLSQEQVLNDDLEFEGFEPVEEKERKLTKNIQIQEHKLLDEPMVVRLNSVAIIEDGEKSALEYIFGILGDLPIKTKFLLGYKTAGAKLLGQAIEYSFPEAILFTAIDKQKKQRTSIWAGAVTGKFTFDPEVAGEASIATVTAKTSDSKTAGDSALIATQSQAEQAPSRTVVELIDETQASSNSGLDIGEDTSAIIVLKMNGYKLIGSYIDVDTIEVLDEKSVATIDQEKAKFASRTDKFEVVEDIEILKSTNP